MFPLRNPHDFPGNRINLAVCTYHVPRGSMVVPFGGSYLESYKVIPKRNYGAYTYIPVMRSCKGSFRVLGFRVPLRVLKYLYGRM